jgi:hypothetical protein
MLGYMRYWKLQFDKGATNFIIARDLLECQKLVTGIDFPFRIVGSLVGSSCINTTDLNLIIIVDLRTTYLSKFVSLLLTY